jgi:hypothetical protein
MRAVPNVPKLALFEVPPDFWNLAPLPWLRRLWAQGRRFEEEIPWWAQLFGRRFRTAQPFATPEGWSLVQELGGTPEIVLPQFYGRPTWEALKEGLRRIGRPELAEDVPLANAFVRFRTLTGGPNPYLLGGYPHPILLNRLLGVVGEAKPQTIQQEVLEALFGGGSAPSPKQIATRLGLPTRGPRWAWEREGILAPTEGLPVPRLPVVFPTSTLGQGTRREALARGLNALLFQGEREAGELLPKLPPFPSAADLLRPYILLTGPRAAGMWWTEALRATSRLSNLDDVALTLKARDPSLSVGAARALASRLVTALGRPVRSPEEARSLLDLMRPAVEAHTAGRPVLWFYQALLPFVKDPQRALQLAQRWAAGRVLSRELPAESPALTRRIATAEITPEVFYGSLPLTRSRAARLLAQFMAPEESAFRALLRRWRAGGGEPTLEDIRARLQQLARVLKRQPGGLEFGTVPQRLKASLRELEQQPGAAAGALRSLLRGLRQDILAEPGLSELKYHLRQWERGLGEAPTPAELARALEDIVRRLGAHSERLAALRLVGPILERLAATGPITPRVLYEYIRQTPARRARLESILRERPGSLAVPYPLALAEGRLREQLLENPAYWRTVQALAARQAKREASPLGFTIAGAEPKRAEGGSDVSLVPIDKAVAELNAILQSRQGVPGGLASLIAPAEQERHMLLKRHGTPVAGLVDALREATHQLLRKESRGRPVSPQTVEAFVADALLARRPYARLIRNLSKEQQERLRTLVTWWDERGYPRLLAGGESRESFSEALGLVRRELDQLVRRLREGM